MTFREITAIFQNPLPKPVLETGLPKQVHDCRQVNKTLWRLEDLAREKEQEARILVLKRAIDRQNQIRNEIIYKMDLAFSAMLMENVCNPAGKFYAETPGMIIDRMSILHIKKEKLECLLALIEEENLKEEYSWKLDVVAQQLSDLGGFLDAYLSRLATGEVFFKIYSLTKIYNDERIWRYIHAQKQYPPARQMLNTKAK